MTRLFISLIFILSLVACGGGGGGDTPAGPDERLLGVLIFGELIRGETSDVDVEVRMEAGPESSRIPLVEVLRGQEKVEGPRLAVGSRLVQQRWSRRGRRSPPARPATGPSRPPPPLLTAHVRPTAVHRRCRVPIVRRALPGQSAHLPAPAGPVRWHARNQRRASEPAPADRS